VCHPVLNSSTRRLNSTTRSSPGALLPAIAIIPPPQRAVHISVTTMTGAPIAERVVAAAKPWGRAGGRVLVSSPNHLMTTRSLGSDGAMAYEVWSLPGLDRIASWRWELPLGTGTAIGDAAAIRRVVGFDPRRHELIVSTRILSTVASPSRTQLEWYEPETLRLTRQHPLLASLHPARVVRLWPESVAVQYATDLSHWTVEVLGLTPPGPRLALDTAAYGGGGLATALPHGRWLALTPGQQTRQGPCITMVHSLRGEVVGPWPVLDARELLWVSDDGQRVLLSPAYGQFMPSPGRPPRELLWLERQE